MKLMRLAMCVAVFALIGGIAFSEDMDIRALQAKLAAQEARLNDLQAKMNYSKGGGEAEGVTSIRKNAVVTVGGQLNTRYFYANGKLDSAVLGSRPTTGTGGYVPGTTEGIGYNANGIVPREKWEIGDFKVSDAKINFKIDVNEYFDAFAQLNLIDTNDNRANVAQRYWIRWKNVCNSGFGLLVGKNDFVYGDGNPAGIRSGMFGGSDDIAYFGSSLVGAASEGLTGGDLNLQGLAYGEGMFVGSGTWLAHHTAWDHSRTTQVTPYWESQDGKFKAELSFFQALDRLNGNTNIAGINYVDYNTGVRKYKSINGGPVNISGRLTWKPIEGLKLTVSAVNFYNNLDYNGVPGFRGNSGPFPGIGATRTTSSNQAVFAGVQWRPCFFDRLNLWAHWSHGWNEGWINNMDSDVFNAGFSFDITKQVMFFAQADYLRVKNNDATVWYKNNAWASYVGLRYTLPYGVNLEGGWRHEDSEFKDRTGYKHTKVKGDVVYAHLGFDF